MTNFSDSESDLPSLLSMDRESIPEDHTNHIQSLEGRISRLNKRVADQDYQMTFLGEHLAIQNVLIKELVELSKCVRQSLNNQGCNHADDHIREASRYSATPHLSNYRRNYPTSFQQVNTGQRCQGHTDLDQTTPVVQPIACEVPREAENRYLGVNINLADEVSRPVDISTLARIHRANTIMDRCYD